MKNLKKFATVISALSVLGVSLLAGAPAQAASYTIEDGTAKAHVQNIGWQKAAPMGQIAGTTGKSLRVEALRMTKVEKVRAHVQDIGWQEWKLPTTLGAEVEVGTTGKGKGIQAIQVLSATSNGRMIMCQAHVQTIGWTSWVKEGQTCGTTGKGLNVEAFRFKIVDGWRY